MEREIENQAHLMHLILDIETEALPEEQALQFAPEFTAPGNYKDPDKIAEAIEAKKREWLDQCALRATTGKVIAVGLWPLWDGPEVNISISDEASLINSVWDRVKEMPDAGKVVGFYSNGFDLPFLIRRSWLSGIKVPNILQQDDGRIGRRCLDLAALWQCGNREERISLDRLAKFFGLPPKLGDGKDFARLVLTDECAARDYIMRDLQITRQAAQLMGVL